MFVHSFVSTLAGLFLYFVLSDSEKGESVRDDLLLRKLVLDVRLFREKGDEETRFLVGKWTKYVLAFVLELLGTEKRNAEILGKYVAALFGHANLSYTDFGGGRCWIFRVLFPLESCK